MSVDGNDCMAHSQVASAQGKRCVEERLGHWLIEADTSTLSDRKKVPNLAPSHCLIR